MKHTGSIVKLNESQKIILGQKLTKTDSNVFIFFSHLSEVYHKIKMGLKPYFRPTLEEYDCPCDELAAVIR